MSDEKIKNFVEDKLENERTLIPCYWKTREEVLFNVKSKIEEGCSGKSILNLNYAKLKKNTTNMSKISEEDEVRFESLESSEEEEKFVWYKDKEIPGKK